MEVLATELVAVVLPLYLIVFLRCCLFLFGVLIVFVLIVFAFLRGVVQVDVFEQLRFLAFGIWAVVFGVLIRHSLSPWLDCLSLDHLVVEDVRLVFQQVENDVLSVAFDPPLAQVPNLCIFNFTIWAEAERVLLVKFVNLLLPR